MLWPPLVRELFPHGTPYFDTDLSNYSVLEETRYLCGLGQFFVCVTAKPRHCGRLVE